MTSKWEWFHYLTDIFNCEIKASLSVKVRGWYIWKYTEKFHESIVKYTVTAIDFSYFLSEKIVRLIFVPSLMRKLSHGMVK